MLFISCAKEGSEVSSNSDGGSSTGLAGSMAKFTFTGDYLYVVQGRILDVYDVSNPGNSVLLKRVDLQNNGVETIFSNGVYLFFGTTSGMLIYSLSNPVEPTYVSTYNHVVSCDPVVVKGDYAYVTLSTGTVCSRGVNQLEVISISDVTKPTLLRVYNLGNPKGMAISGNYLYLCDEVDGFTVMDITDPDDLVIKSTIPGLLAHDVIVNGEMLTITAKDGVYQYNCSDPLNLKFVSKIKSGQ
jgi:hypothetical protein